MSSKAGKVKKGVLGGCNRFPIEMYNTPVGSVVICGLMFAKKRADFKFVRKQWKEYKKNYEMFDFQDENFIDNVLNFFGITRPSYFPIAMVQSEWNVLFAPYDKKHKMVLPLREDGFVGPTLKYGKIYPIEWNKKVVKNRLWWKEWFLNLFRKKEKKDVALQG